MKCLNDPNRSYSGTEPSPKGLGMCAHAEKVGTKANGKDGRAWIVKKDKNGTKSWKPQDRSPSKLPLAKQLNLIGWRTTDPTSSANLGWDADDKPIPVPKELLDYQPGFRAGDRAAIAWPYEGDGAGPFTVPITGKTILALFKSIERGMRQKIKVTKENTAFMESWLPRHSDGAKFSKMYAAGTLTPFDFIRDAYDFWEGGLQRDGKVWGFGLGS